MFESTCRLTKTGTGNMPVQVRSTGCYRVGVGWREFAKQKKFLELFWVISGTGEFIFDDGNKIILKPNQCCCYFPGDTRRIRAIKTFEYCRVSFDGEKCSRLIDDFSLTREPWDAGKCPQELFARLRSEVRKPGIEGEIISGAIGYELLARSKTADLRQDTILAERFIDSVEKKYSDPDVTIDAIAEELGVHRSTLVRNVLAVCKKPPQQYLTEFRLNMALNLLNCTGLSVKEISEKTGYATPNYFGKVFRKAFGKTPSEMRDTHNNYEV